MIHAPAEAALARMTARVRELTPYSDARRLAPADAPGASPIPRRVGDSSPIKHVFYVIRENRTYDQVLGDLPKAQRRSRPRRSSARRSRRTRHALARDVRHVRQLLRRRRGQLRRPCLLDRRLCDRFRREDVAGQLRPPRRPVPERRRLQDAQPVRQHRRAAAGLPVGLREARRRTRIAATASSPAGARRGGRCVADRARPRRAHPSDLPALRSSAIPD